MTYKTVLDLNINEEAYIVDIYAGHGLSKKLESIGIVKGQKIKKLSSLNFRGPQVLCVDRVQIVIGRGIAEKITIQPITEDVSPDKSNAKLESNVHSS